MHLAVDAGGTSTRAILLEPDGTCRGYGVAGGGNPVSWGAEAALGSVVGAVAAAVEGQPGVKPAVDLDTGTGAGSAESGFAVEGTVIAMAGSSVAVRPENYASALAAIGVTTGVLFESDLLATFCAGTSDLDGYAVVAGTGSSAISVTAGTVSGTADGLGWLLGDAGSGFWIGHRVARAAVAALDDRGPATLLSSLLPESLDIGAGDDRAPGGRRESLRRVTDALYSIRPVELSRFAASAFRAAEAGDPVAQRILADAERSLLDTLDAVRVPGRSGPVVLGGGIARRLPGLPDSVADMVRPWGTEAPVVIVVTDGIVGAGVLALRHGGILVGADVFDRLVSTVAALRPS
jgi:N-acetylglucosamine kinase-like BadF-type ATPase